MSDAQAALDELKQKVHDLAERHRYATQWKVLQEGLSLAKAERSLEHVISFLFNIANACNSTATPNRQREAAVELVAILESEDAARRVQPDLPDERYELCKFWYTSCAYDNLAIATACLEGYNSEGMYGVVGEGIEKCRQTGKTECITCFREYATAVSLAADDLELAEKQARYLANRDKDLAQHDRRAVARKDLGRIQLLRGELQDAVHSFLGALEVSDDYHDPGDMQLSLHRWLKISWLLLGTPEAYEAFAASSPLPDAAPEGEALEDDRLGAQLAAVEACCAGDPARAVEVLEAWCARWDEHDHLANWFEDRCRLIHCLLLADQRERAEELGEETSGRARTARDWLTQRRIGMALAGLIPPTPIAAVAPLESGPFAPGDDWTPPWAEAAEAAEAEAEARGDEEPEEPEPPSPHFDACAEWEARLREADDPVPILEELAAELVGTPPASVETDKDAWALLTAARWCVASGLEVGKLWRLARLLGKRYPDSAAVQSVLASVGDAARVQEQVPDEDRPGAEEVGELYKRALELDVANPGTYYDAGLYYASNGAMGEAERCFARACRLDRTFAAATMALARVYDETDRPSDAVDVLDLAIRNGCHDPPVVWEAALSAFNIGRWEPCLSYLDLFLTLPEVDPEFGQYYRAHCLFELGQPDAAIEAMNAEEQDNPHVTFAAHALRSACHAAKERPDEARRELESALAIPLGAIERLSPKGIAENMEKMRVAATQLGDPGLGERIVSRARRAGLLSDEYYEERRLGGEAGRSKVFPFRAVLTQSLPPEWKQDPDCPVWEADWAQYVATYLLLAPGPEEARAMALAEQAHCAGDDAEVEEVIQLEDAPYNDVPGVISQGVRRQLEG